MSHERYEPQIATEKWNADVVIINITRLRCSTILRCARVLEWYTHRDQHVLQHCVIGGYSRAMYTSSGDTEHSACYSTAAVHTDEVIAQSICAVCTHQLIVRHTATDKCYSILSRYTDIVSG